MKEMFIAVTILLFSTTTVFAQKGVYARLGMGVAFSGSTHFTDKDCNSTSPPALFGCQDGPDGRPIGARGDFGSSMLIEGGLGYDLDPFRFEVTIGWHPGLDFSGQANFLNVPLGHQPVTGNVDSKSLMLGTYLDLASLAGKHKATLRPFLGAAIGVAHNSADNMLYLFPSISRDASTQTPSGTWTGFSWSLTAGVSVSLSRELTLDVGYRYHNLGTVRTDMGTASIDRPNRATPLILEIAPTEASLHVHDLYASMRYAF